ncbi:hypothetical protein [Clostridium paridis]|nr:hypothetical protein [Clostridium paridis]
MSYNGEKKMDDLELPSDLNLALSERVSRINNPLDIEAQEIYLRLKNSTNQMDLKEYLQVKLEYPELNYTEYPLKEFRSIKGVLSIIGMSPNNDNHN